MKSSAVILLAILLAAGCSTKNEQGAGDADAQGMQQGAPQSNAVNTPPPAKQDVTTEGLSKIDPEVRTYDDAVAAAKKAYTAKKDEKTKSGLIAAYVRFGDYMTYESPVSPRQGKYHRALIEYRHALTLDPENAKVLKEIAQIEDIYHSMGRPIPATDL